MQSKSPTICLVTSMHIPGIGRLSAGDQLKDRRKGQKNRVVATVVGVRQLPSSMDPTQPGAIFVVVDFNDRRSTWQVNRNLANAYDWAGRDVSEKFEDPLEHQHPPQSMRQAAHQMLKRILHKTKRQQSIMRKKRKAKR